MKQISPYNNNTSFLVTGSMRSGTTLLASLINAQDNFACLEVYPYNLFRKSYECIEALECELASRESEFIHAGIDSPKFKRAISKEQLIFEYSEHVKHIFGVSVLGYKRTMLSKNEIVEHLKNDTKVILMKRSTQGILKSWVRRIDPNIWRSSFTISSYLRTIDHYDFSDIGKLSSNLLILEFDELTKRPSDAYQKVNSFLGCDLSENGLAYYSFNKNRKIFVHNSSVRDALLLGGDFKSLKNKYTEKQYNTISEKMDSRKILYRKYGLIRSLRTLLVTVFRAFRIL